MGECCRCHKQIQNVLLEVFNFPDRYKPSRFYLCEDCLDKVHKFVKDKKGVLE